MQLSGQPPKIELPLANNSTARAAIPATTPTGPGRATQQEGFPPLTRTDPLAGGIPPDGLDMNGMLYLVSAVTRWVTAGGGFQYDAAFAGSTNVAGYPKGARILNDAGTGYFQNLVDGNTTNPNTGGTNWARDYSVGTSQYLRIPYIDASTGAASEWIVQCGVVNVTVVAAGGTATVTLPIAFPNAGLAVLGNLQNSGLVNGGFVVNTSFVGLTQITVSLDAVAGTEPTGVFPAFWLAIGR